jgi:hypothetical protein
VSAGCFPRLVSLPATRAATACRVGLGRARH